MYIFCPICSKKLISKHNENSLYAYCEHKHYKYTINPGFNCFEEGYYSNYYFINYINESRIYITDNYHDLITNTETNSIYINFSQLDNLIKHLVLV